MLAQLLKNGKYELTRGFVFSQNNEPLMMVYKHLNELGLIEFKINTIYDCVNRDDKDYVDLTAEERTCRGKMLDVDEENAECRECSRVIERLLKFPVLTVVTVTEINTKVLDSIVGTTLRKLSGFQSIRKVTGKSMWTLQMNDGVEISVALLDNLTSDEFLYQASFLQSNIIFLGFDAAFTKYPEVINALNFLVEDSSVDLVNAVSSHKHKQGNSELLHKYIELDTEMTNILGNRDWGFFEREFSSLLFDVLSSENPKLLEYMGYLEHNRHNIKGAFIVNLGGASNTDIKLRSKFDYLMPLFSSTVNVDPKCYAASKLTKAEYDTVVSQWATDINPAENIVILTLATKITADVWTEAEKFNKIRKENITIIPRYLLLEIISASGKTGEFSTLIKDYLKVVKL